MQCPVCDDSFVIGNHLTLFMFINKRDKHKKPQRTKHQTEEMKLSLYVRYSKPLPLLCQEYDSCSPFARYARAFDITMLYKMYNSIISYGS